MKRSFKLGDNRFSMGPFLKCPYPEMVECCALSGFDFAIADLEHTPISPRELLPLALAAERHGLELIVRIPENLPMYFKWCLDLGVVSVQIPHIQCAEDAVKAVKASHFFPSGERGLCRFVRAADYSAKTVNTYLSESNARARLILMVEGEQGLRNIDEILRVQGIDTIFIGPYDLSQSLGRPGEIWHPTVLEAMSEIIQKCDRAGIQAGTFADTHEGIQHWVSQGAGLIEFGSDLKLFLSGAGALLSGLR